MRYALILAGGRGSRLWPLSRGGTPKQFLPLIRGRPLLEWAYRRLDGVVALENRYVCAGERHRGRVRALLPELAAAQWLGEPCGRDTLAAVSLGFMRIRQRDPDATIAMIPADLYMTPLERFQETLMAGFKFVETQPHTLLTFGVPPTYAATGYGWVELGALGEGNGENSENKEGERIWGVRRFCEKPALDLARRWYEAGSKRFLWNAGIFIGNAATFCELLQRFEPDINREMGNIAHLWDIDKMSAEVARRYLELKCTSVDYAILERAAENAGDMEDIDGIANLRGVGANSVSSVGVAVMEFSDAMEWADVGSWTSAAIGTAVDGKGNTTNIEDRLNGEVAVFCESTECSVFQFAGPSRRHRIRLLGVHGIIVVETDEFVLITTRDSAPRVRGLADRRFRYRGWSKRCRIGKIDNIDMLRRIWRKHGGYYGVFIDCDDNRFAMNCAQRVVVLGVTGVDMVADGCTITLASGGLRARYGALQRLRKLEWIAIPGRIGEYTKPT